VPLSYDCTPQAARADSLYIASIAWVWRLRLYSARYNDTTVLLSRLLLLLLQILLLMCYHKVDNKQPTGCEAQLNWKCPFTPASGWFSREFWRNWHGFGMPSGFFIRYMCTRLQVCVCSSTICATWLTTLLIFTFRPLWPWKVVQTKEESVTDVSHTNYANLVAVDQ